MRVLVVEDDADVRELVRILLREEGHAADVAGDATDGALLARTNDYDLIVLDVRLPDGDGVEIARTLRREGRLEPILMLTAQRTPEEVVRGLDAGADDYLTKPFEPEVLKARVRALLRRAAPTRADPLACANLVVNRLTRQALVDGVRLPLTTKEFAMLEYLVLHADEVVTRAQLLEHVWERHRDPDSNVIDVHVARLRAKLRETASAARLETVRGVGFMITAGKG
ncbi:MAG TPA: response regulator transcription factor [Gemmatimonadaceae bacterium]|nr:response regulator transcription factor [Gemmatimonadaceae bacterium]